MASIHRRPRSPYWRAAWRDSSGRLHARSTKQPNRSKALAVALEFERAQRLADGGTLTEIQARRVVGDILERTGTGTMRTPTTREFLTGWLASQPNSSPSTLARRGTVVRTFLTSLGDAADRPLLHVAPSNVERFLADRAAAGSAPGTIRLAGAVIRGAFARAVRQGLLTVNPASAVDLPKAVGTERATFTMPEVKMLVDAAEGDWKTAILIGAYTGARLGDAVRLRWDNLDLAAGTLTYQQRKTGGKVTIPLHPQLAGHLEGLAGSDTTEPLLMPGLAALPAGGRSGLSEQFKVIVRLAGLDLMTVKGAGRQSISRRTFHSLRHTFASALANVGVAPEVRMAMVGHRSEKVHAGYSHLDLDVLRAAVGRIS